MLRFFVVSALVIVPLTTIASPGATKKELTGRWTVNSDRSGDPEPMMDLLGVSSVVRFLAPKSVTQDISRKGDVFTITVKGFMTNTQRIRADGKTELRFEVMGQSVVAKAVLKKGALVTTGTITINGEVLPFTSVRRREGADTVVVTDVGRGEKRVRLVRVFERSR